MRTVALTLSLLLVIPCIVMAQSSTNTVGYTANERGAVSFETVGGGGGVVVGYARVQPGAGSTTPSGVAIFGYRTNGVLVTEAGVPATSAMISGRTYAEVNNPINTVIAIANPNGAPVTVSFYFTDGATGTTSGSGSFTLGANQQMAAFLNQTPFNAPATFMAGTFTFSASAPVAVIALRGLMNERGEFLITTQTVADLSAPGTGALVMGHFADGGGWKTRVTLVNTTDQPMTGTVQFYGEGSASVAATPVTLTVNGQVGVSFTYAIPARASVQLETSGPVAPAQVGSVRITPTSSNSPSGFAVFSYRNGGVVVTESSVSAQPARTAFRTYVETTGTTAGTIQSAIGVTNASASAATVTFELTTLTGASTGLTGTIVLGANGHAGKFLTEIFPGLSLPFRGVLRVSFSTTGPVAVTVFRTRYNERNDFLITTTPATDETGAASSAEVYFPHVVDLGGYTTQFVLFSGLSGQAPAGTVRFFNQAGAATNVTIR